MTAQGWLFANPRVVPLTDAGKLRPGSFYKFFLTGTTTPAAVYRDATLTTPFVAPSAGVSGPPGDLYPAADASGQVPPIFLDNTIAYRVQLWDPVTGLVYDVDPVLPAIGAYGSRYIQVRPDGGIVVSAATSGVTWTSNAFSGNVALQLGISGGSVVGNLANLAINNSAATGTGTATWAATNKPGGGGSSPSKWLPIACDGATYYAPLFT